MESLIRAAIEREFKKRLSKYSRQWYYIHKYRRAFSQLTIVVVRYSNTGEFNYLVLERIKPRSFSVENNCYPLLPISFRLPYSKARKLAQYTVFSTGFEHFNASSQVIFVIWWVDNAHSLKACRSLTRYAIQV